MYIRTKTTPNSPRKSVQIVELQALAASEIARLEAETAQIQPALFASEEILLKNGKGRPKTTQTFPAKLENNPVPDDVQLNMLLKTDRFSIISESRR